MDVRLASIASIRDGNVDRLTALFGRENRLQSRETVASFATIA